ncbi:MAG: hypothetical protein FWG61_05965 [Firmicutes bacterium]|nr:hypothetical protein [Bacillota bacterium]
MAFEDLTLPPIKPVANRRYVRRAPFGESTMNPELEDTAELQYVPSIRVGIAADWKLAENKE